MPSEQSFQDVFIASAKQLFSAGVDGVVYITLGLVSLEVYRRRASWAPKAKMYASVAPLVAKESVRNLRKKNRSQPQPTLYDLLGMSERELDTRLAVAMSAVSQQDVAFLTEYFDAIPLSEADQPHVAGRDFEVRPVDSFRRSQIVDRDV